jgi:hypothetical protein
VVSSGFSPVIGGPAALPLRRGRSGCASPRPADAVDYCEREGTGCRDGAWVRDDPSGLTGSEGLAGSGCLLSGERLAARWRGMGRSVM